MDLSVGRPRSVIWKYTLPLFGSIVFQQLYNIADSLVAGKFIGENALAAIGNSYEITLVYLAFAFGCNIGASVVIARCFGEKDYSKTKSAISTALILTGILCATLSIIGGFATPSLLRLINTPSEIFEDTLLYLNIYTGGLVFLFFYNIVTGVFAALGDSKTPFIFLSISSISNIGLDILFVKAFQMGVGGVAWATFICQGVSCLLCCLVFIKKMKSIGKGIPYKKFSSVLLKDILKVSIPSTIQQGFVSAGNIILQSLINSYGTAVIAGYSAAIKFNNFAITSIVTVGNGTSNYTAQNLGANKPERIKQGYKSALGFVAVIVLIFSLTYVLLPDLILKLFLNENSTEAAKVGVSFLRIASPFYIFGAVKITTDGVVRGAKKMHLFLISTFIDIFLRVLFAFILSPKYGSDGIWYSWPGSWIAGMTASIIFLCCLYKKGFFRCRPKEPMDIPI